MFKRRKMATVAMIVVLLQTCYSSEVDSLREFISKHSSGKMGAVLFISNGRNCGRCDLQAVAMKKHVHLDKWYVGDVKLFSRAIEARAFRRAQTDYDFGTTISTVQQLGIETQPSWAIFDSKANLLSRGMYGLGQEEEEISFTRALRINSSGTPVDLVPVSSVRIIEPPDSTFERLVLSDADRLNSICVGVDQARGWVVLVDLKSGRTLLREPVPDSVTIAGMMSRERSTLGTKYASIAQPIKLHRVYYIAEDELLVLAERSVCVSDTIGGRESISIQQRSMTCRYSLLSRKWYDVSNMVDSEGRGLNYSLHNAIYRSGKLIIGNPAYRSPFPSYDSIYTYNIYDLSAKTVRGFLSPEPIYSRSAITYGMMDTYCAVANDTVYAVQKLGSFVHCDETGGSVNLVGQYYCDPMEGLPAISEDSSRREAGSRRMSRIMSYKYRTVVMGLVPNTDSKLVVFYQNREKDSTEARFAVLDLRVKCVVRYARYIGNARTVLQVVPLFPSSERLLILTRDDECYRIQELHL